MVQDVLWIRWRQRVYLVLALRGRHQKEISFGEKAPLPLYAQVILLAGFAIHGDFGRVAPKRVYTWLQQDVEITIPLQARELDSVQINFGFPADHVRNVPIN